jgi:hypothetical protein
MRRNWNCRCRSEDASVEFEQSAHSAFLRAARHASMIRIRDIMELLHKMPGELAISAPSGPLHGQPLHGHTGVDELLPAPTNPTYAV